MATPLERILEAPSGCTMNFVDQGAGGCRRNFDGSPHEHDQASSQKTGWRTWRIGVPLSHPQPLDGTENHPELCDSWKNLPYTFHMALFHLRTDVVTHLHARHRVPHRKHIKKRKAQAFGLHGAEGDAPRFLAHGRRGRHSFACRCGSAASPERASRRPGTFGLGRGAMCRTAQRPRAAPEPEPDRRRGSYGGHSGLTEEVLPCGSRALAG